MSSLASRIRTAVLGHPRHLTGRQLAGAACVLCGRPFFASEYRASYGWIGLPPRRRAWACEGACTITAVPDVEVLFRSAIPARQAVTFWHLGLDDSPPAADGGGDVSVQEYADALDAEPKQAVEIAHRGGVLTTRPLPQRYAGYIAVQARELGFTATVGGAP